MNIKVRAAAITAGLIVSGLAAVEVFMLALANFSKEQITQAFGWVCMGVIVFCIYKLVLLQLEMRKFDE